jgi:hypothetical protein
MHRLSDGYLADFKRWREQAPAPVFVRTSGASDAAPEEGSRPKGARLLRILAKLSDEDLAEIWPRLRALLAGEGAEDNGEGFSSPFERELEPGDDPRNRSPEITSTGPKEFRGMPKPGGKMVPLAGDIAFDELLTKPPLSRAQRSFANMFPDAMRVKVDPWPGLGR